MDKKREKEEKKIAQCTYFIVKLVEIWSRLGRFDRI